MNMADDASSVSEMAEFEQPRRKRKSRPESILLEDLGTTSNMDELPQITGEDGFNPEQRRLAKENEKIQAILSSNKNTGAKVVLSRKNRLTGRYAVLMSIPVDEYDEDQLGVEYGGGQYMSRIRLPNSKLTDSWTWDVDSSVKPSDYLPVNGQNNSMDIPRIIDAVRERSNNSNGEIREVIETITDRNAQTFQMMMKQMQDSNAQMMTLIASMSRHNAPQDTGMATMMTTMLTAIMNQKTTGIDQMVDAMVKLKELANEDSKGGNDVMDTLIGMLAPFAGQLMGKLNPQLPPSAPVEQPEAVPQPRQSQNINAMVGMILRMAEKNTDPVSGANVISDLMDEPQADKMIEFLKKSDWWMNLTMSEPKVLAYKQWFENLRKEILDIFDENEDDTAEVDIK